MGRAVLIGIAVFVAVGALAQEDATVWVASPWERVMRDTPPGETTVAQLRAAANEYEPFRLIVHAGDRPLRNVDVLASSLNGPGGAISAYNITLYRAHYLHVPEPSYRTDNPTGYYPDALIPFVDPQTGEPLHGATYDASPFDVEPGQNAEVWCDLFVPPGTRPGEYRGTVTVAAGNVELARVPVELRVWDFELPDEIAMRSNFGALGSRVASFLGMDAGSDEFAAIEDRYIQTLLDHRAIPGSLGDIWPDWSPEEGLREDGEAERLRRLVEEEHVNALRMPFPSGDDEQRKAHIAALADWLRELGYLELAYIYMKDEPNDAEEYEIVRQQGALIEAADPDIARLCTEQTKPSDPAWGDLYGAVDIWCPLWGLWDEPTANQRLALGEELWSYTALCQGPEGTPWWQIDMEPLHYRAPFWVSWHYDITGFLYWSSVYWGAYETPEGVWEAPHFRERFWGEGMLLYPGQPAGIDGPVTSIRLKLVREAMEDYEYMVMAAQEGGRGSYRAVMGPEAMRVIRPRDPEKQVNEIVAGIATSFQDWSHDARDYARARERLAEIILDR